MHKYAKNSFFSELLTFLLLFGWLVGWFLCFGFFFGGGWLVVFLLLLFFMFGIPCATDQPHFTHNGALKHRLCIYLHWYIKSLCKMIAFFILILSSTYYLKCIWRATKGFCSIKNICLQINRNTEKLFKIKHRDSSSTSVKPQVAVASNPKFIQLSRFTESFQPPQTPKY